jgi:hypothetical protein
MLLVEVFLKLFTCVQCCRKSKGRCVSPSVSDCVPMSWAFIGIVPDPFLDLPIKDANLTALLSCA